MSSDAVLPSSLLQKIKLPEPLPTDTLPRTAQELRAVLAADREQFLAALDGVIQKEIQTQIAKGVAAEVQKIIENWRLARYRQFGPSSETQGQLFNEVELMADKPEFDDPHDDASPLTAVAPQRKRGKRQPLPPELPRVEHVIDVPQAQRTCECGTPMTQIGQDISEQLDIIPLKILVRKTVRPIYACPRGDSKPIQQPAPAQVLPRSNFGAGLLAMLLTVKYVDGLPLNRFATVLARHDVTVPRQSLARAAIKTAQALQPIHNLLRDTLLEARVIHMDETTVQVLKEPDKAPSAKSYMWVQRSGPPDKAVVLFDYDPRRAGAVPVRLLADWQGYLMTDGYEGYGAIARQNGVEHLACMAHARRKFVEAKRAQPKGKSGRADQAIALFARLYAIERDAKEMSCDERYRMRQEKSLPALANLKAWLDQHLGGVTPKSKLGEALAYLAKMWPKLIRYTETGDLPIDNNLCENAIRPFVVGRKGWLFADTPAGAHASAVVYSLIETAKANGKEPYAWLRFVLEQLPFARNVDDIEKLLPWNTTDEDLAMNLKACEAWG